VGAETERERKRQEKTERQTHRTFCIEGDMEEPDVPFCFSIRVFTYTNTHTHTHTHMHTYTNDVNANIHAHTYRHSESNSHTDIVLPADRHLNRARLKQAVWISDRNSQASAEQKGTMQHTT